MKEKFINNYMNIVISNKSNLSSDDIDKMKYGIEGIYLTVTKLIIVIGLGIILGIIKEILILLLLYNILRFFGFGYHAKGSKECLIFSICFFVLLPYLVIKKILIFKYPIFIILICAFNFILFAPSDTKKRPMINKKKKLKRKIAILVVTSIYAILSFNTNYEISALIILALIIQSIMVNPFIYMLTKEPYNNYKNYLKEN